MVHIPISDYEINRSRRDAVPRVRVARMTWQVLQRLLRRAAHCCDAAVGVARLMVRRTVAATGMGGEMEAAGAKAMGILAAVQMRWMAAATAKGQVQTEMLQDMSSGRQAHPQLQGLECAYGR